MSKRPLDHKKHINSNTNKIYSVLRAMKFYGKPIPSESVKSFHDQNGEVRVIRPANPEKLEAVRRMKGKQ